MHLLAAAGVLAGARWGAAMAISCAVLWIVGFASSIVVMLGVHAEPGHALIWKVATLSFVLGLIGAWVAVLALALRLLRRRAPVGAPRP